MPEQHVRWTHASIHARMRTRITLDHYISCFSTYFRNGDIFIVETNSWQHRHMCTIPAPSSSSSPSSQTPPQQSSILASFLGLDSFVDTKGVRPVIIIQWADAATLLFARRGSSKIFTLKVHQYSSPDKEVPCTGDFIPTPWSLEQEHLVAVELDADIRSFHFHSALSRPFSLLPPH